MVKPIMRDVLFLGQKSVPATEEDLQVGRDLQDTLAANREACVGMAANMIGVKKRIIIVNAGFRELQKEEEKRQKEIEKATQEAEKEILFRGYFRSTISNLPKIFRML